jgi:hypothetical protein
MPLISEPLCPQCGQPLPTRQLWRVAAKKSVSLLSIKCGIKCPLCQVRLRILQGRVVLFNFLILMVGVGFTIAYLMLATPLDRYKSKLTIVIILLPVVLLQMRFAPCFVRVAVVIGEDRLTYPLDPSPPPVTIGDAIARLRPLEAQFREKDDNSDEPPVTPWRCGSCGEENPGEFDCCWKCQKDRPVAGI